MTINELAQAAAVTTRTIRYYVEQGVLPPPTRGRPAEYTEEHVQRLELIRRLKEQYLPLEEIRDTLQRLSLAQVEELLAAHAPPPKVDAPPPPNSAAEYITGVLGRGAAREHMKRQGEPSPFNVPPPGPPPSPGMPAPNPAPWPAPPAPLAPPMTPAPAPEWVAPYAPPLGPQRRITPVVPWPPQLEQAQNLDNTVSTWQRIPLAPGIELHYQVTANARVNEVVDRLVEAAGRILDEVPEKSGEETP